MGRCHLKGESACGAVRGRLQHPVAAAHDCQEGGDLLALALYASAKVGVFDVAQRVKRVQPWSKQIGLGLKTIISGTTI